MKLYKDKEWLKNKYSKEELSTYKIAKICGITQVGIYYWIKKFNISCRSHSEANHLSQMNNCNLSQEAIEWINGELLCDGCLISRSPYSAKFEYISKYIEYIKYIKDTLKSFGIKQSGKIIKRYNEEWNCSSYYYQSCDYIDLLPIYIKWYPKGKKIIPKDLRLTPITLRQHYIGDGSLMYPKKERRPFVILDTERYSIFDVEWLIKQLIELNLKVTRQPSRNIIHISVHSTKAFLNFIGKCPVKCYQYKFAY